MGLEDNSIIELFMLRDERAIKELSQKYGKLCRRLAENILSQREDAEECVSDAYLAVWRAVPPNQPKKLSAYLCRIVKNNALKRLQHNTAAKRNSDLTSPLDELSADFSTWDGTESDYSAKELSELINRFLYSEKEQSRKIFVRRYWFCDSTEDIAKLFGIKPQAVATELHRTRTRLKEYLEKEGYYL